MVVDDGGTDGVEDDGNGSVCGLRVRHLHPLSSSPPHKNFITPAHTPKHRIYLVLVLAMRDLNCSEERRHFQCSFPCN